MGKPILYYLNASPPVRAVLLTARAIGLELELREVNLLSGDHLSEEFKKKNPQHTIPTLEDGDVVIWDSHAIVTYLVSKYGKDDKLYPKDLVIRAKIDQRLHFDTGILFARLRWTLEPILFRGSREFPEEKRAAIQQAYDFLESFLKNDQYMVGNTMTVADFCAIASVSSLNGLIAIDSEKHPKLAAWIKKMESLPYYDELNRGGADALANLFKLKMSGAA